MATGTSGGPIGPDGDARPLGGVVRRTGLAVVRRGELVVPAEGSEAEIALAHADSRQDIEVHLPIVVEVVGEPDPRLVEQAADLALRRLRLALDARDAGR